MCHNLALGKAIIFRSTMARLRISLDVSASKQMLHSWRSPSARLQEDAVEPSGGYAGTAFPESFVSAVSSRVRLLNVGEALLSPFKVNYLALNASLASLPSLTTPSFS